MGAQQEGYDGQPADSASIESSAALDREIELVMQGINPSMHKWPTTITLPPKHKFAVAKMTALVTNHGSLN